MVLLPLCQLLTRIACASLLIILVVVLQQERHSEWEASLASNHETSLLRLNTKDRNRMDDVYGQPQSSGSTGVVPRPHFKSPGTLFAKEISANNFQGLEARPYRRWPSHLELPCFEAEDKWASFQVQNNGIVQEGFLFLRPKKCGSTSSIGMVLRFLYKLAHSKGFYRKGREMCRVRFDHGWRTPPLGERFQNRHPDKSFLWSILRDPTSRAISQYYFFQVSHSRVVPTDDDLKEWLDTHGDVQDYYLKALSTNQKYAGREAMDGNGGLETAKAVLREYDFIGITGTYGDACSIFCSTRWVFHSCDSHLFDFRFKTTNIERFDESAVVMMMLLDIPMGDMLYLSIKQAGGFDFAWYDCMYVWKPYISPSMQGYFLSEEWQSRIQYDAMLYRAANRSLDLTIDTVLGRPTFTDNLHKFQNALKVANARCAHTVLHRCTEGGEKVPATKHDCLWDNGMCIVRIINFENVSLAGLGWHIVHFLINSCIASLHLIPARAQPRAVCPVWTKSRKNWDCR